jgi:tetratricopeptide (TPR) repeat protein
VRAFFKSLFKGPGASLAEARERQKAGEPRAALALYRKALAAGAPAAPTRLQLGVLHAELAEYDAAIDELRQSLAAAPDNTDALCMLGSVMTDLRRAEEAAKLFARAIELRPDLSEAHFNLGIAQFERGELDSAAASFARCAALNRGEGREFTPQDMAVNAVKLNHDCQQLEYLLDLGRLPASFRAVLEDYRALRDEVRGVGHERLVPFDAARHPHVARTYKRPLHIADESVPDGPLVNPGLDFRALEARYAQSDPNVIVLDGLLTPAALGALRRFCFESTFWNNIKPGYLGAYFYDGFCSPLLLRLAWELRAAFPGIFRGEPLQMMWGYKCEHGLPGLAVHADAAAVNVNFWITPDEANLEPEGGGLLVYPQDAPADWGFAKYNHDPAFILRYLESTGGAPIRVPYRANRAVIFDSDLFHATDRPQFREGYLNRRINITLLYGARSA